VYAIWRRALFYIVYPLLLPLPLATIIRAVFSNHRSLASRIQGCFCSRSLISSTLVASFPSSHSFTLISFPCCWCYFWWRLSSPSALVSWGIGPIFFPCVLPFSFFFQQVLVWLLGGGFIRDFCAAASHPSPVRPPINHFLFFSYSFSFSFSSTLLIHPRRFISHPQLFVSWLPFVIRGTVVCFFKFTFCVRLASYI